MKQDGQRYCSGTGGDRWGTWVRDRGSKDDDTEFGQETQLQYNAFDLFDYGDAPLPFSLS